MLTMPTRLVSCRSFSAYAYLPGRHPHPVRDTDGHSYGLQLGKGVIGAEAELFWGADLLMLDIIGKPMRHGSHFGMLLLVWPRCCLLGEVKLTMLLIRPSLSIA